MAKQSTAAINSSSVAEDIEDIKQQLKDITRSLAKISPLITEIKSAYDNYNQTVGYQTDHYGDGSDTEIDLTTTADLLDQPPGKTAREEFSILSGMAKVVNKMARTYTQNYRSFSNNCLVRRIGG